LYVMQPEGKERFAKLGNDNYYAWSYRMEMRLRKVGVWAIVDGTESMPQGSPNSKVVKAWRTRVDLALNEIIGEVSDGQLVHTRVSREPKVVWDRLKEVHESQGLGSVISTWQKFFQMRKANDVSIQAHAGAIREVADRLTGLGDEPSEALMVAVLMLSLPVSYGALVISLDSHADRTKFDFVVQHCLNEEARQLSLESSMPSVALHAAPKPRRDKKDIVCFKCGKKGHYRNECKEKDSETSASVQVEQDVDGIW